MLTIKETEAALNCLESWPIHHGGAYFKEGLGFTRRGHRASVKKDHALEHG